MTNTWTKKREAAGPSGTADEIAEAIVFLATDRASLSAQVAAAFAALKQATTAIRAAMDAGVRLDRAQYAFDEDHWHQRVNSGHLL